MLSLSIKKCFQSMLFKKLMKKRSAHGLIRNPLKILNDEGEEYFSQPVLSKKPVKVVKNKFRVEKEMKVYFTNRLKKNKVRSEFDSSLFYIPINNQDSEYLTVKFQITNKKSKISKKVIVLEGKRLIADAIKVGLVLKQAFFVDQNTIQNFDLLNNCIKNGASLYQLNLGDMKTLSECVTSPRLIAVFEKPSILSNVNLESILPVVLIADNIRDPGNLGALIRSSAAAGIDKILLTKGCVDVWESKVIRSACGAHFRIKIESNFDWNLLNHHLPPLDSSLFIANLDNSVNETDEVQESSNVPINNLDHFNPKVIKSYALKNHIYSDVKYFEKKTCKKIGLIIGGETHGVSQEAYNHILNYHGSEINIPIEKGVNSLNSAISASILLFEIKRQFNKQL